MASFTIQASEVIPVTESSTNTQVGGIESPEAIYQGNNEASATGVDSFRDSGVFCDESYPPKINYQDFQLYEDDLPEIDPAMDRFFADADASISNHGIPFYHQTNDSGVGFDARNPALQLFALGDDAPFFSSILDVVIADTNNTTSDILSTSDSPSQSADIPAAAPQDKDISVDPLSVWLGTSLRHERVAYLLSQQPQPVRVLDA
ncbi:hypothetical protein VTL71DRAFT_4464 [Oculimacula yallundae]|uniref:Uncharacterized protein n=1 Tax=Oculimacula yallundae TaxID=86028 RepID=A0ABR4C2N2_9HELO